jgi:hypothetical protein
MLVVLNSVRNRVFYCNELGCYRDYGKFCKMRCFEGWDLLWTIYVICFLYFVK